MESGSEPASPFGKTHNHRLADIIGTAIALLTLTLPLFAIAYYSSSSVEVFPPATYPLPRARE
ncbi:hypothetical protein H6G20_04375 [Desertifilum sp. FACHB-1129]|uniref:Uncharacterized protein n=3 Tax=Cyanophyceae TaxID=3028117 RepID=A0A1E5QLD9_9CYAN|nr:MULTISPECIES: hypothetical protein [Cyanophyceae]MCD8487364.1 hypothetical protein [Desertifilum sp.]MDA0208719.1 hypothetical protein [Cyanobacteria bacterium FC1]MDI9640351.1 hypothetical protein [Geitlerinema splendidum]MDK3159212.1 hypothetical protein [Kamptonema cortianum]MBD2310919.1 hypothetical protein [Desertifilum sp. FACHB-1129]